MINYVNYVIVRRHDEPTRHFPQAFNIFSDHGGLVITHLVDGHELRENIAQPYSLKVLTDDEVRRATKVTSGRELLSGVH